MHTLLTLLPVQPGILATARIALADAQLRWAARRGARQTARTLADLDDRTLHDLGMDRSEIEAVSAEAHGLRTPTLRRTARA
ncbi:DUF1127 domain-containing protein [Ideonella sp. YS5]|uniref:DUF1127 domain-containing protein n=1 Tax=Ideonella sp. YS5 TaxID=3453714 RepID=UPI003EEC8E03